jgi:peptidoglycan/LPS O-acetylase OafA/YrhL
VQQEYLPALTGLRFWLAMWVILHHICGKGMMLEAWVNATLPDFAVQIIHGGYLAVQTFFVLSGFVLARTYAHARWDRRSVGRFFTARFARIYPVYLVSLVVVSPFIIEMLRRPSFSWMQRSRLLAEYIFVLQGWRGSLGVGWNTPAWSLSCEFFFYLWFPVLFVLLRNARWRAIAVALAAAILLPRLLDHAGVPWDWKPIYDLGDFASGIAAARIFALVETRRGWRRRGYWLYVPAALIGAWLIANPRFASETTGDLAMYLRPLNVMALLGFALGGGVVARALSVRVFDFLGKASYSMYVLHVPILWWLGRYLVHGKLHLPRPLGASIYFIVVIVASGYVYQWLEHPGSEWIRSWQKRLAR